jgi:hypothetical protein
VERAQIIVVDDRAGAFPDAIVNVSEIAGAG